MNRCIVFSGHYRTFEKTCEKIKQFIEMNDILDVYCHLWIDESEDYQNQIEHVKEVLSPVKMKVDNPKQYEQHFKQMEQRIKAANPKGGPEIDNVAGNISMNFSRGEAFRLIDREYDELVYCRYDIGFHQLFNFEQLDRILVPEEQAYNLISDIFAIMPFKMAKSYFLYDNIENNLSTQWEPKFLDWLRNVKRYPEHDVQTHIHTRYCPHLMLMRNIIMDGNDFAIINIPVYLQR